MIFDLDGTLVDSMWMWKAIDVEYLARFDLECPEDLQKEIEGMSFSETAAYFQKSASVWRTPWNRSRKRGYRCPLEKYKNEVPLKPGARAFLDYISMNGIVAGIATSNGRAMVDAVLDSLDIRRYFKVVTTACEVAAGKPSPDIYLEAARRMKVSPEECAVFEDVPAGILAGKRAGMEVFAVEDEYSLGMEEKKESAL